MPQSPRPRKYSAACAKKKFEHCCGFAFANACVDFRAMVAGVTGKNPRAVDDATALGIVGPVIKPGDTRMRNCTGTHRAGFKRDPQVAIDQSLSAECGTGGANRGNLCMGGRIMASPHRITRTRNHRIAAHDHGTNRNLPRIGGEARALKRQTHRGWKFEPHFARLTHNSR